MQFFVGASRMAADTRVTHDNTSGELRLLYPPASRGKAVGEADVASLFDSFAFWGRCPGAVDAFSRDENAKPDESTLLEDTVASLNGSPFAYVAIAEPIAVADEEISKLRRLIPILRNRKDQHETDRLALERAEARLEEIIRFRTGGLWNLHVLVGATNPQTVREISALMTGAIDLGDLPYRLEPASKVGTLQEIWASPIVGDDAEPQSPFQASAGLVATVARPPSRELPGIRSVEPPDFDVTSETADGVHLGTVLDRSRFEAGPFTVSHSTLNRHTFVCGATGSGKSQTTRTLLEKLAIEGIPWLVIEPAKSEYSRMHGRLEGIAPVTVIRPGAPNDVAACLNPLQPEEGFPIQAHIDMVRALFATAFEAQEPFPQILAKALQRVYEDCGWDLVLSASAIPGRTPSIPTLGMLQDAARTVVETIGYGEQVMRDVRGFIDVRVGSLRLGATGKFFEGGHPIDMGDLLSKHVVLAIEDVANNDDKAFLIGAVVIRLVEHLRLRAAKERIDGLRHVTVIEEAHRLLRNVPNDSPAAKNVEIFAEMLAEIRAYGEGIVIAEQIPSKVIPDVIKNTALKIVHRLPAQDDREQVGATMNLTDKQSRYIVTLEPGTAAAFADGMDAPILMRVPYGEDREREPDGPTNPPISASRSLACGHECTQVRPCSNREIQEAANKIRLDDIGAVFTVWSELMLLSLVLNEPMPIFEPALRNLLKDWDKRQLECVIGQSLDEAVTRRSTALRPSYQPEDVFEPLLRLATEQIMVGIDPTTAKPGPRPDPKFVVQGLRWLNAYRAVALLDSGSKAPAFALSLRDMDGDGADQKAGERRTLLLSHPWGLHLEANRKMALLAVEGVDQLGALYSAAERVGYGTNPEERAINAARLFLGGHPWLADMLFDLRANWLRDGRVYIA
jgi:DNA helicase HerA-like ATPase